LKDNIGGGKGKNRNPQGVWTSICSVRTERGLEEGLERLMKPKRWWCNIALVIGWWQMDVTCPSEPLLCGM